MSKKIYIIFTFLLFNIAWGKELHYFKIEHLSIEQGLSQNTVRSILQDSRGYLWFATEDGLNRYDGYKIKSYRHNQQDVNSISDNFIWNIYETRKGEIWVGTNNGGLNRFDREKERFIGYQNNSSDKFSISSNNVRTIIEDQMGRLWIGTEGGGLNRYDPSYDKFYRVTGSQKNFPFTILSIIVIGSNELLLGTDNGIVKYFIKENKFENYYNSPVTLNNANNIINVLFQDNKNRIWVGSDGGLFQFDIKSNTFKKFSSEDQNFNRFAANTINSIFLDKSGNVWFGSYGGLGILYSSDNSFQLLEHNSSNLNSLSNNHITTIIEDKMGILWAGTTEGGVNKINNKSNKFTHYKHDPFDPNSLSYSTIRSIYQDSDGILWIGTMEGGLNRLDRGNNKFKHYKYSPHQPSSLSDNTVTAIVRTKRGELWVGTWGGGLEKAEFNSADEITGFRHFKNNPSDFNSLSSNIVQAILEDSFGRLWIGTQQGLDLYDRHKNIFYHFKNNPSDNKTISDNKIQSNCIYEDRSGNIWVGTWNGLNKIVFNGLSSDVDPSRIKFERYYYNPMDVNSISNSRILSMYEDNKGILWVGTYGGGLNKIALNKNNKYKDLYVVKRYSEKDGLSNDIIYGILGDEQDNLWLSTNNGLSKFNPTSEMFQNYYSGEGLQSNQFYWGACYKGITGELFFGGINGLNSFYPSEIKYNTHVPPVYFTDFQIFNRSVQISENSSPLSKSIEFTNEITLDYSQNVLTFEFVALDYFNPRENKYAYKMENFDKDWVKSGRRNFATYTNLDPGEYTFRVIGANNDEIWNKQGASLKIIVLPPFWQTWWFILISLIVIGGTIFTFIKMHIRDLLAVERVRIKLAADLHDNIGASLTEISILSEIISKRINSIDNEVKKNLRMISDTSRELIDKMSDIVWLVNPKRDSLYDLILRLEDTYSEILSCTNISFRASNLQLLEKVSLSMERRQNLYLIFKEAINNAITHSNCTELSLDTNTKGRVLEMILNDNGCGIRSTESNQGNGLINMKSRAKLIGGELSIISLPGKGTTVKFIGTIS